MKKNVLIAILTSTALTTAMVTGCGASSSNVSDTSGNTSNVSSNAETDSASSDTETKTTSTASEEAKESGKESDSVVKPLYPLETAQDAMADGGYSVSFTSDDLAKTDEGYELTVEVYEYDRYEATDIDNLKKGSQIQFCSKTITVDEIEKNSETNYITINGGIENDGIELIEEDGLYRTVTFDDHPVYYSVGKITLPLSEDVTFEDYVNQATSEPQSEPSVTELKELPVAIKNSEISFTCNNTEIIVRQEQIIQIIRHWTP